MSQGLGPGSTFGPYVLDELVESSDRGSVFHATDTRLHRRVSLTVTPPDGSAAGLTAIESPYLLPALDAGELDGLAYVASRQVDGTTLAELLGRGPLPRDLAAEVCGQVADAMRMLHAQGVCLGHLEPDGVLVRDVESVPHVQLVDLTRAARIVPGSDQVSSDLAALERLVGTCLPGSAPPAPASSAASVSSDLLLLSRELGAEAPVSIDSASSRHSSRGLLLGLGAGVAVLALLGTGVTWWLVPDEEPAAGGDEPTGPVTLDVDGDGLGDFAFRDTSEATNRDTRSLAVLASDGEKLKPAKVRAWQADSAYATDMDADGKLDLVALGTYTFTADPTARIQLGNGRRDRQIVPLPKIDSFGQLERPNFIGDLDGNGAPDVGRVVEVDEKGSFTIWVSLNVDGTFQPAVEAYSAEDLRVEQVLTGDFDGDGDEEVLLVEDPLADGNGRLRMLQADGAAALTPADDVATGDTNGAWAAGDFDGDGTDEALAIVDGQLDRDDADKEITVWSWDGSTLTGEVWGDDIAEFSEDADYLSLRDLVVSDLNGDGKDDLGYTTHASGNYVDHSVWVLMSEGGAFTHPEQWGVYQAEDAMELPPVVSH